MIKKLYIGIDPDLRLLNAAIVSDQMQALAVFKRSNKGLSGDKAVAQAANKVQEMVSDIQACISFSISGHLHPDCEVVLIVESQNMEHARTSRKKGIPIPYQKILQLGQIAGIMMGAFVGAHKALLVQAQEWKGTVPKRINQARTYAALNLTPDPAKKVKNIYPANMGSLCYYSHDKINPGDFMDINDSLGLALYGAKKGL